MITIIDNYLPPETVAQINREWPADGQWTKKVRPTSLKWTTTNLPPAADKVAKSIDVKWLSRLTGIKGLLADPELFGGGLHCIPQGGFLKMHVDFNEHPNGWHRRVNLLIYLNENWNPEWGGDLQYGLESPVLVSPIAGRCVVFETNETSWHGHPEPLKCPPDRQRRSLALYFYTETKPEAEAHTTIYK